MYYFNLIADHADETDFKSIVVDLMVDDWTYIG
jgi:hypothetical protein